MPTQTPPSQTALRLINMAKRVPLILAIVSSASLIVELGFPIDANWSRIIDALLITNLTGLSWPGLPSQFVDLVAVVTMAAMIVVLVDRINKPAKRFLSTFEDWFTWTVTFLPVLTGWMAVQHLLLPYTLMLAIHILTVEILLIVLPFTKLFHAFTLIGSRWYNGKVNGQRGVPV